MFLLIFPMLKLFFLAKGICLNFFKKVKCILKLKKMFYRVKKARIKLENINMNLFLRKCQKS